MVSRRHRADLREDAGVTDPVLGAARQQPRKVSCARSLIIELDCICASEGEHSQLAAFGLQEMRNLSSKPASEGLVVVRSSCSALDIWLNGSAVDSIDEENDTLRGPHLQLVDRPSDDNQIGSRTHGFVWIPISCLDVTGDDSALRSISHVRPSPSTRCPGSPDLAGSR